MHRYSVTDRELAVVGALYLEPVGGGGLRPHRLPEPLLEQVPDLFMRLMVDAAAGVRIRFATAARHLEILLAVHPLELVGMAPVFPAFLDLVVDGEVAASREVTGSAARLDVAQGVLDVLPGEARTVVFDGLRSGEKIVEVWLPHTAAVDVFAVSADEPVRRAPEDARPRWVHHGSSISHCMEAPRPTQTWPAVAALAVGLDLLDLGYAGSAMLDPFVARAIRDTPADLITLKIGINLVNGDVMRMRAFLPAVHGFLDTIREGHPETPVVVVSPIACPIVEHRPGPTGPDADGVFTTFALDPIAPNALTLERIREALVTITDARRRTDPNLAYLDGRDLFDERDAARGLLPDGLHPSADGYRLMGERFAQRLPALLPAASPLSV